MQFDGEKISPTETFTPILTQSLEPDLTQSVASTTEIPTEPGITEIVITPQIILINSPFADKSKSELSNMISNPYHPPVQGSDDPHQGVDFSDVDNISKIALPGKEVRAILGGEVVSVMNDRFPYGNAILVATDEKNLPNGWKEDFMSPERLFAWESNTALTCPEGWNFPPGPKKQVRLYTLYAHLLDEPNYEIGENINSGDKIGAIGMSGNALAPHLHIEVRYGYFPDFSGSMAHYDVSASLEEMSNYCRWRVSGWFRLIDPMQLFSTN